MCIICCIFRNLANICMSVYFSILYCPLRASMVFLSMVALKGFHGVSILSLKGFHADLMRPQAPCRGVDGNPKVTREIETGDPWYDFWSYAEALCHQDLFRKWQVLCHQDLHKTLHKTFVCEMPCAGSYALPGFPVESLMRALCNIFVR